MQKLYFEAQSFCLRLSAFYDNSSYFWKIIKNCTRLSWLSPALARSALTSQAEAAWTTYDSQLLNCAGTSFTNVIYTKLSTFPSRKKLTFRGISCSHFFDNYFMAFINKRVGIQSRKERQSLAYSPESVVLRKQFCKFLRPFGLAQGRLFSLRTEC